MLQLSNAAAALARERAWRGMPDHFGARISPGGTTSEDGNGAFRLDFVEQPEVGDQIAARSGTSLFVAPEVAAALAHSVLDVQDTERGAKTLVLKANSH